MGFIHRHFVEKTSDSLYLDSSSPMTNTIRVLEFKQNLQYNQENPEREKRKKERKKEREEKKRK
jgi:hypothetical protein